MAQNDFVIADQTASAALADINSALQSLASCSSGTTQPSVRYANQLWYDTTANILKIRNEANSAWISLLYVHQTDNAVHILDNTYISDTSGNHVGLLGDQATSEWTTGTGTTESLVSPAKMKAAILALAPDPTPVIWDMIGVTAAQYTGLGTVTKVHLTGEFFNASSSGRSVTISYYTGSSWTTPTSIFSVSGETRSTCSLLLTAPANSSGVTIGYSGANISAEYMSLWVKH